jgi:hypothetical protein
MGQKLRLKCEKVDGDDKYCTVVELIEANVPPGMEGSGVTVTLDKTVDVQPFTAGRTYLITEEEAA